MKDYKKFIGNEYNFFEEDDCCPNCGEKMKVCNDDYAICEGCKLKFIFDIRLEPENFISDVEEEK